MQHQEHASSLSSLPHALAFVSLPQVMAPFQPSTSSFIQSSIHSPRMASRHGLNQSMPRCPREAARQQQLLLQLPHAEIGLLLFTSMPAKPARIAMKSKQCFCWSIPSPGPASELFLSFGPTIIRSRQGRAVTGHRPRPIATPLPAPVPAQPPPEPPIRTSVASTATATPVGFGLSWLALLSPRAEDAISTPPRTLSDPPTVDPSTSATRACILDRISFRRRFGSLDDELLTVDDDGLVTVNVRSLESDPSRSS